MVANFTLSANQLEEMRLFYIHTYLKNLKLPATDYYQFANMGSAKALVNRGIFKPALKGFHQAFEFTDAGFEYADALYRQEGQAKANSEKLRLFLLARAKGSADTMYAKIKDIYKAVAGWNELIYMRYITQDNAYFIRFSHPMPHIVNGKEGVYKISFENNVSVFTLEDTVTLNANLQAGVAVIDYLKNEYQVGLAAFEQARENGL